MLAGTRTGVKEHSIKSSITHNTYTSIITNDIPSQKHCLSIIKMENNRDTDTGIKFSPLKLQQ